MPVSQPGSTVQAAAQEGAVAGTASHTATSEAVERRGWPCCSHQALEPTHTTPPPIANPGSYSAAAGNGGVNASIQYELDRPDNFGLKRGL